jgi:hypothetical protein
LGNEKTLAQIQLQQEGTAIDNSVRLNEIAEEVYELED